MIELTDHLAVVAASGLVDHDWYHRTYAAMVPADVDAVLDYVRVGWRCGRSPGPLFDSAHYARISPDVVAAGVDPVYHYVRWGWREGRTPREGVGPHDVGDVVPGVQRLNICPAVYEAALARGPHQ